MLQDILKKEKYEREVQYRSQLQVIYFYIYLII